MLINSAEQFVSDILRDGLWHTTAPERFKSILEDGHLKPEPDLADGQRHKTGNGPSHWPYVRTLGGLSLFDFVGFDAPSYEAAYPISNWRSFVPVWTGWPAAVWIELDRGKIHAFISGRDLLTKWKSEAAHANTIMPMIEAAHIGKIATAAIRRALTATRLPDGSCRIAPCPTASRSAPART